MEPGGTEARHMERKSLRKDGAHHLEGERSQAPPKESWPPPRPVPGGWDVWAVHWALAEPEPGPLFVEVSKALAEKVSARRVKPQVYMVELKTHELKCSGAE